MIVTKKREFNELMENIKNYKSIFLLGCSECAALCGTGGEPEVKAMKEVLESKGKRLPVRLLLNQVARYSEQKPS